VICARFLAARCLSRPRYQDQHPLTRNKRKPQTSHGGRVRCKPESGIQVWKGCLMSLTVLHETVLHVAQMRPESWEMVKDSEWLSAPRKRRSGPRPIAAQETL
jgi:hypothetical protein